ncbi:MAG TPA: biotin/lipoyl-containing protein [Candidatus Sulfotelmatobacter sp.]|nr:biotin/lipoyl-containing protein [Candidatus Sulfotelmatobacter sp.]
MHFIPRAEGGCGKSRPCRRAHSWVDHERGAKLLTLEAMKMQSNIYAPISGKIQKLMVTPGQHVEAKDRMVVIAP